MTFGIDIHPVVSYIECPPLPIADRAGELKASQNRISVCNRSNSAVKPLKIDAMPSLIAAGDDDVVDYVHKDGYGLPYNGRSSEPATMAQSNSV